MAAGVRGQRSGDGFVQPKRPDGRRMRSDGDGRTCQLAAQAHIEAWVRLSAAQSSEPSRFWPVGPRKEEQEPGFVFFFFQEIEKWKLAQKKIEKVFFPCG